MNAVGKGMGRCRGSEAFREVKRLVRMDVEKKEMTRIIPDLLREQLITKETLI